MISKKKLKERLLDICNGAGMVWQDDGDYFEYQDTDLECLGNLIQAIERAFNLKDCSRLRLPWRLKEFADIDEMTDFVYECLEHGDVA